MSALFDHLPENFFVPLASPNRRHYAALLLRFYEGHPPREIARQLALPGATVRSQLSHELRAS